MEAVAVYLDALGYPEAARFGGAQAALDQRDLQSLVIWLENQKIRHYAVADRKALTAPESELWETAYAQYLADLGCPAGPAEQARCLAWLCSKAVSFEYADRKEEMNATSEAAVAGAGHIADWSELSLPPFADAADPGVADAVHRMRRLLRLNDSDVSERPLSVEALQELDAAVRDQVLPALPENGPETGDDHDVRHAGGETVDPLASLARFPLGFSTGDAAQDGAATILRLLYLRDLRRLQSQADAALEGLQAHTARVMAEASFGRPR